LKQAESDPYPVEKQVALIYAGTKNLMRKVPIEDIKSFERDYLALLDAQYRNELDILKSGKINDEITDILEKAAKEVSSKYAD
jgi:F-type H+-transporting ATPase subunit alpha